MNNSNKILIPVLAIILVLAIGLTLKFTRDKNNESAGLLTDDNEIEIIRSDEDYGFEIADDDSMRETVLYFKDKQDLLVPVMIKIPWEEGIAKLALKNMVDSPELRETISATGLTPIIPAGTEILGMSIDPETGLCKVDFSKEVLNCETKKDEENLINGVVYTLTEFPTINEVQLMVEGKVLPTFKHGTDTSSTFKRENINLAGNLNEEGSKVVVYFKGQNFEENFEYYVPVTIPTLAPVPNMYTALEVLFDGPPSELGLTSDIPEGVSFHGIDISDGTAYVDVSFDYEIPEDPGIVLNSMVRNIGLTLSEFDNIESVELLIDGKTIEEAGLNVYINETIPAFANVY